MRIVDAALTLSSRSETTRRQTESVSVRFALERPAAALLVSPRGRELLEAADARGARGTRPEEERPRVEPEPAAHGRRGPGEQASLACDEGGRLRFRDAADIQLVTLRALLEKLTGRRFELIDARDLVVDPETQARIDEISALPSAAEAPAPAALSTWGLELVAERRTEHSESVRMRANGIVRTADGREIALATQVSYERREVSVERLEVRAGAAVTKDPLALVFDGTTPSRGQSVDLDLDLDGRQESVPLVGGNAAFLVHDRNGNGRVDDGSELFGATSGDGFAELAALDEDGNGFIDDGDAAMTRLYLWEGRDAEGDRLTPLAQRGVGALYTGATPTRFELKTAEGEVWAVIRETGIFLTEEGNAGLLQQVDLVV